MLSYATPLDLQSLPDDNLLDRVKALEDFVARLSSGDVEFASLDEAVVDFGVITSGLFVSVADGSDSSDPTDTGFTGVFMGGNGISFGGIVYHCGAVLNGVLGVGFNEAGQLLAAAGGVTVDAVGITLLANTYPAVNYLLWEAADTAALVGSINVSYGGAAVNTGMVLTAQAHDAGVRGYIQLAVNDNTGTKQIFMNVDSNGNITMDLTGSVGAPGTAALTINTKVNANALNNALYLNTDVSAAAAGLGSAIAFQARNSAGTMVETGYYASKYVVVTAGAEVSKQGNGFLRNGVLMSVPIGGPIVDHLVNGGNVTTGETDLYTDTLIAGQWGENGDKIVMEYSGSTVANATATRRIRVYCAGTVIWDSTALATTAAGQWFIKVQCQRTGATAVRCTVMAVTNAAFAIPNPVTITDVSGLTLTNTQIVKITGQAGGVGAATNDILAKTGVLYFYPAA